MRNQVPHTAIRVEMETRRAQQVQQAEEEWSRLRRKTWLRGLLWPALGTLGVLMSAHSDGQTWGLVWFWGGSTIGYGGMFVTWLVQHLRGLDSGDL
jgi:hypothetical protein